MIRHMDRTTDGQTGSDSNIGAGVGGGWGGYDVTIIKSGRGGHSFTKGTLMQSQKVSSLVIGALSPVNRKEFYQGQKQRSIHLVLLIPHKSHETAKFFKIHKISLDKNVK